MVGMAQRDSQRIGAVGAVDLHAGKLQADHMIDLLLGRVADADDRLLDRVRGIFADLDPGLRGHQQRDRSRLSQLQRRRAVLVDECLLHRRMAGLMGRENRAQLAVQIQKPTPHAARLRRLLAITCAPLTTCRGTILTISFTTGTYAAKAVK